MYDANHHPEQEVLDAKVGHLLAETVRSLNRISSKMDVEALSLAKLYGEAYQEFVRREEERSHEDTIQGS